MKTKESVKSSAKGALKKAEFNACRVLDLLDLLKEGQPTDSVMPELRERLSGLEKFVHEYNAYQNVLGTE